MTSNKFNISRYLLALSLIFTIGMSANAQEFQSGEDYIELPGEAYVLKDGRVEVIEFFWFGCPACYQFEPYLANWNMPENIRFTHIPAVLNRSSLFHAHVYYAMNLLKLEGQLMDKFYAALHAEGKRINDVKALETWASQIEGIDAEKLAKAVNSFATVTKVGQAEVLAKKYRVSSTPTLVIGGKYQTSPYRANSEIRALQLSEFLTNKILSEQ